MDGQGHVDDEEVQDDHERPGHEDGQGPPRVGGCRRRAEAGGGVGRRSALGVRVEMSMGPASALP